MSTFPGGGAFTTTGAGPDEFTYRAGVGFNAALTVRVSVHLDDEFEGRSGSPNLHWQF